MVAEKKSQFRKPELPAFDGTNLEGWILEAERCFTLYQPSNAEKLEMAIDSFEGGALLWHQKEDKIRSILHWEEMKILLLRRFHSSYTGTPLRQWLAMKQEETICEKCFKLSSPLENRTPIQKIEEDFKAYGSPLRKSEDKELLAKEEVGKEEGRLAEPRVFSPAISVLESGGGGGGSGGGGGIFCDDLRSRGGEPRLPADSTLKIIFGNDSVIGGDGSGVGGRYSDDLGVVFNGGWGFPRDRSGSPADSVFEYVSGGNSGSVGGGSEGGGGARSGGVGGNTLLHSTSWNLLLLGTKEEPTTQREMGDYKERKPKKGWWEWWLTMFKCSPSESIFWVFSYLSQSRVTKPLVLRRPLVDVIGARLHIGMVNRLELGRGAAGDGKPEQEKKK